MPILPEGPFLAGSAALHVLTEALAGLQNGESARRMGLGGTVDRMKNVRLCLVEAFTKWRCTLLPRARCRQLDLRLPHMAQRQK